MHPFRTRLPLALACLLAAVAPAAAAGPDLDVDLYARLLALHSREVPDLAGTRVDYRGLRRDPQWAALMEDLGEARPDALPTRSARIAFWINVYNLLAMRTVLQAWPVASIRDAGSLFRPVWRRTAGVVAGREVSLHEIEHEILRPLGEPRIHFALVCASTSCPSLAREPYRAVELEAQLEASLHRFLADRRKGMRIDPPAGTLTLSRIFDWFEEDFESAGGIVAFVRDHLAHDAAATPDERAWLAAVGDAVSVRYFDYDWALNDLAEDGIHR